MLSFPDYATPIGSEIFKALHGERDYPPDVLQLLYVANRGEKRAQIESWIAAGVVVICDRYVASSIAYGEAHGIDAAWLGEIQRFLPAPHLTILLDIAPDTAVGRKAAARDRFERDLDAARPRAGELSPPGRRVQLGAPRRRAREGGRRGRRHSRGRDTTRAAVTALTSAAPAARTTSAHASSVAPVVLTSSTRTIRSPSSCGRAYQRLSANAFRMFSCRASAGRSVCEGVARVRRRASTIGTPSRAASSRAWLKPRCRRRLRWSGTGTTMSALREQIGGADAQARPEAVRERAASLVLEGVQDRAQRAVVGADGPARGER